MSPLRVAAGDNKTLTYLAMTLLIASNDINLGRYRMTVPYTPVERVILQSLGITEQSFVTPAINGSTLDAKISTLGHTAYLYAGKEQSDGTVSYVEPQTIVIFVMDPQRLKCQINTLSF